MLSYLKSHRRLLALSTVLAILWFFLLANHPYSSLISFDEGFHGGSVIWQIELIKQAIKGGNLHDVDYIRHEFNNGVIYYPPLWNIIAVVLGFLFGLSTNVFRAASALIGLLTLVVTYWLARRDSEPKVALGAAAILATIPMFFVYSHLMMLEVPFAFGLILALAAFYWYLETPKSNWQQLLLVTLAFVVGVQGKVLDVALIIGTILAYGLGLLLVDRRSQHFKKLLNWPTVLFMVAGVVSWYGYIWAVKHFLGSDMLDFFTNQSSTQSGNAGTSLRQLLINISTHYNFYRRDFLHYPWLSLVWIASAVYSLIWLRRRVYYYLATMMLVTWLLFSAIFPQVPQYIMPVYIGLAIMTAATLNQLSQRVAKQGYSRDLLLVGLTTIVVVWQLLSVPASESFGWRHIQTYQQDAADYVAAQARANEPVFIGTDGVAYSLRLAGLDKKLVSRNLTSWPDEVNERIRWAIVLKNDVTGPEMLDKMDLSKWQLVQSFGDTSGGTDVYFNPLN